MRLNKWLVIAGAASARRQADELIEAGRVSLDGHKASLGARVEDGSTVRLDNQKLSLRQSQRRLIRLYKPAGVISSHRKQGKSRIVFDLLPNDMADYIIVGRLDKDSEGLMLLTNDGQLAHELMHPSFQVERRYLVRLNRAPTESLPCQLIQGVNLDDGVSIFTNCTIIGERAIELTLQEGRNRQIRRTMRQLGYRVEKLIRLEHGPYSLVGLRPGEWRDEVLSE